MVRAKFTVQSKEVAADNVGGKVVLLPVVSGSKENEEFYNLTPAGQIELSTINQAAFDAFEQGKEYYVDFSEAIQENQQ